MVLDHQLFCRITQSRCVKQAITSYTEMLWDIKIGHMITQSTEDSNRADFRQQRIRESKTPTKLL